MNVEEFKECEVGCKIPDGDEPTVAEDEDDEEVGETPADDDDEIAR